MKIEDMIRRAGWVVTDQTDEDGYVMHTRKINTNHQPGPAANPGKGGER